MMAARVCALALAAGVLPALANAEGRTIEVGPNRAVRLPSDAAKIARDGDTVVIDSGEYRDCAVWRANRLTITALGTGAVLNGTTCEGKGIFITAGDGITIRNITFENAKVQDHNGAGIRAEGGDLTIENCRFLNNENGILSGARNGAAIRVIASEFDGNGACIEACAHGIYAGAVSLLEVERSTFTNTHQGHHIKSRAFRTFLRDSVINDGPAGNSSYLVDVPDGGDLLIERNRLTKGPHSDNPAAAVSIGAEGAKNSTHSLVIHDNSFSNLMPRQTDFVRNQTGTPAELSGNRFTGLVTPLEGAGTVR